MGKLRFRAYTGTSKASFLGAMRDGMHRAAHKRSKEELDMLAARVVLLRDRDQLSWKTISIRMGYTDGKFIRTLYWRHAEKGMRHGPA